MKTLSENYIRRERQRLQETRRVIKELRESLKVCTKDEIRMAKMPYFEALLIGLEEKGYFVTSVFIQQLIDFQNEMREKAGTSSSLWLKPQLKESKNILKTVCDGLVKAEEYRKMENYGQECEKFLKISTHISFLHADWWWLGEQLLLQSISIAKDYPFLGGKYEALSRYVYGKFLVENVNETDTAYDHLVIVRELSNGTKWTIQSIFPDEKNGVLFLRANYLLHLCLMHEVKRLLKSDPNRAIRLAGVARKRAAEACYLEGESRALLLKGVCELSCDLPSAAIATFTKAYYIQERIGNLEGICETRLQLAQAYLRNGDTLPSLKTLIVTKECAENNQLHYYLAEAYKHLGEFYLNNAEPRRATPFLGEALKILHETGNIKESEQVRNMEAISTGLELFPKYISLLSNTKHPEIASENLVKLVNWKDSRKQFWDNDDDSGEGSACTSEGSEKEGDEVAKVERFKHIEEYFENNADKEVLQLHINLNAFEEESDTSLSFNDDKLLPISEHQSVVINTKQPVIDYHDSESLSITGN